MATFDLGRVTPIYKGDYSASASYELNDVVLYNGNLYWHVKATATVGVLPTNTTVWKAAFDGNGIRAEIRGYAYDAQASANSAQASRTAVAQSASQAFESATQASTYAANASASATEASASATNAEASATQAQEYAEQAEESAEHFVLDTKLIKDSANGVENQAIYPLLGAFPTDSASGSVASFSDGADEVPLKSLTVNIDPVQDTSQGDPSPTNICPISGWTGMDVEQSGVNVWDEEWEVGGYAGSTGAAWDTNTRIRSKTTNYISVLPNTTYYVNAPSGTGMYLDIMFYNAGKTFISSTNPNAGTTFTTPSDARFMRFASSVAYGTTYNHDISINYPNTDHSYHPYTGRSIAIDLGQTVYGGKLDVLSGKLVIDRAMVDLGTLTWIAPDEARFYTTSLSSIIKNGTDGALWIQSSMFRATSSLRAVYDSLDAMWLSAMGDISISKITDTAEALKTAVTGQQLVYDLATSIEIQLTPNEVNSLYGQNNIYSNTGDTSVEYRADPTLYISKKIAQAISALS